MDPPSPEMRKDTITIKVAVTPTGVGGDLTRRHREPGVTIPANVSAPDMVPAEVAEKGVAMLRARVMCSEFVLTQKGTGVVWQGRTWEAGGPMVPESKQAGGTAANYRFEIEAVD